MNEMKDLETQLRSWAPRRPSPKLAKRLFASAAAIAGASGPPAVTRHESPPFRLSWLAPAVAAVLLMCVLFNQRGGSMLSGSPDSGAMVGMIVSNQSAATYLPGSFQRERNGPRGDTFEWTNGSSFTSSIRSLSPARVTN